MERKHIELPYEFLPWLPWCVFLILSGPVFFPFLFCKQNPCYWPRSTGKMSLEATGGVGPGPQVSEENSVGSGPDCGWRQMLEPEAQGLKAIPKSLWNDLYLFSIMLINVHFVLFSWPVAPIFAPRYRCGWRFWRRPGLELGRRLPAAIASSVPSSGLASLVGRPRELRSPWRSQDFQGIPERFLGEMDW